MKTRAAALWHQPGKWEVDDFELDGPGTGEALVEMVAAGLCHSDDHIATGDTPVTNLPFCGGHEGSGIVREVGPGVTTLKVGDHVVTSFIPSCGKCLWCARGLQNLCDNGALILSGAQFDGGYRLRGRGHDVATMAMLGTFSQWQVMDESSLIKVRDDVPLGVACLVACGVPTGWGSAVNGAQVSPGDVVIVMGAGGVGMNAVQGAAHAGAGHVIVVDPQPFKREIAGKFGATHTFADIAEATDFARSITNGQGADSAIVTVGVIEGQQIADAFNAIRKAGTVAVTSQGAVTAVGAPINLFELSMYQKRIQGVLYGMTSPRAAVPRLLDMYMDGQLKLDELVTKRYDIDDINLAFDDMHNGQVIRGVIDFTTPSVRGGAQ
jgi:NDMA-dependent alcohol dehydrogenase